MGAAADAIRAAALARVAGDDGVRVEDYLTVLAAVTGEATLVDALGFDIEGSDLAPGAAVFGDRINELLSGDQAELADAPPGSVVGILRDALVPGVVAIEAFGTLERLYRHVAASIGSAPWGEVALTVAPEHGPRVMALRVAFELREAVAAAAPQDRHVACAQALAAAIAETAQAIDPAIALTLSLEVAFGMAKTVPMSHRALEQ